MAHLEDCLTKEGSPFIEAVLEFLSCASGSDLADLIRGVLNGCMRLEREEHLQAKPYERTEERQGHANGFKDKTVKTRLGEITFSIPQVREGGFTPQSLERGLRSERALKLAVAEMYVQGVSTRNVAAITEKLCGLEISSTQVSRAACELDGVLKAWRERPLGECPYLFLDAR
jgi:putative transposase